MDKDFAVQVEEILEDYRRDVAEVTTKSRNGVARASVNKLRSSSPVGYTGKYAKGWHGKKLDKMTQVVHNATAYQLTHLLENGHVVRNAYGEYGRAPAHKHIEPVEAWASEELIERIEREL